MLDDLAIDWVDLGAYPDAPEVAETGDTFEANARIKAEAYSRYTGATVLADDSGLEVDALGGRPGVHSARYAGPGQDSERNIDRVLRELGDRPDGERTARFVCVMALAEGGRVRATARGACEGRIAHARRGSGGFGYDPVFLVPGTGRTFGELSPAEKDRLSHRARALAAIHPALAALLPEAASQQGGPR